MSYRYLMTQTAVGYLLYINLTVKLLQISSDMRQSKLKESSFALRGGIDRHTTAPAILFRVMHVRRNLQYYIF